MGRTLAHPLHPPARGRSRLWVRSALAPAPWSRWLAAGLLGIALIAGVDLVIGSHAALASVLAVIALAVGLGGGRGDALVVAGCCVAVAALSGALRSWDARWTIAFVVVLASSVSAVLVSLLRAAAATTARQLELLRDVADLARGVRGIGDVSEALLQVLVPRYADAALLDLADEEGDRRVAVRVAGADGPELERWLRSRAPADASLPGTRRVIATGRSAFVEDVDDELLRGVAGEEGDLDRLRRLRARSALTLPLATRDEPFGALTLIVGASGRRYSGADAEFAELVQGRLAMVLDNAGLSRAAARSEAVMGAALDSLAEAVTMNGPDGTTVYVNQAAVRLLQADSARELMTGRVGDISSRFALYDEHGEPLDFQDLPAFRALGGEQDPPARLLRNVVRATGEERWLLNKVSVLRDADGEIDRIVNVIEDVTQVKSAEVRQRLLAEATRVLSGTTDLGRLLAGVASVVVPDLADWSAVEVAGRGDAGVARAGREPRDGDARLMVGLPVGDERLGTIALGRAGRFSDDARRLAEEVGQRAAIAVLNARLARERAQITRELQEGLRPPELPAVPGLRSATLYRPAGELNDVGGDFYDAFGTARGWTLLIGDVTGQGARAATLTGLTRFTLRSVAQHTGDHGQAIAAANRALVEHAEMSPCTIALVRLQRAVDGGVVLASLSAGHPLPILVRDGVVREIGAPGPIAGVFEDAAWVPAETPLREGDTIVLYTDGVPDTVGADGRFGDERLLRALEGAPPDPSAVVARIDAALAAFQHGPQRDDTAIVAVTVDDHGRLLRALGREPAPA